MEQPNCKVLSEYLKVSVLTNTTKTCLGMTWQSPYGSCYTVDKIIIIEYVNGLNSAVIYFFVYIYKKIKVSKVSFKF